jgi:hypothetical protein
MELYKSGRTGHLKDADNGLITLSDLLLKAGAVLDIRLCNNLKVVCRFFLKKHSKLKDITDFSFSSILCP